MGNRGQAIIETLIAILLLAFAAGGVFGVVLTVRGRLQAVRGRASGELYAESLRQVLKRYVTADPTDPAHPDRGVDPGWHLQGDACPGQPPDCWALAPGDHDVGDRLFPRDIGDPYHGTMTYTVTPVNVGGHTIDKVVIHVAWKGAGP